MRYTATFSFDADDFASARRFARSMRNTLRDHGRGGTVTRESYADANVKLRKVKDGLDGGLLANPPTGFDTVPASASVAHATIDGSASAVNALLRNLVFADGGDVDVIAVESLDGDERSASLTFTSKRDGA